MIKPIRKRGKWFDTAMMRMDDSQYKKYSYKIVIDKCRELSMPYSQIRIFVMNIQAMRETELEQLGAKL